MYDMLITTVTVMSIMMTSLTQCTLVNMVVSQICGNHDNHSSSTKKCYYSQTKNDYNN